MEMYLGQLPYKVIIGKKNKKQNSIPTDSKSMPGSHAPPKKRDKNIALFQNEIRGINKMI
jgi:hypothetical protein